MLHLQREPAERPFEALEVGDVAGVAEIANVHVALFDLPVLEVELLLHSKSEAAEPAGRSRLPCWWTNCRSWTQEENAVQPPFIGSYNGVFSSQRKSIAAHSPSVSLAQRELAV